MYSGSSLVDLKAELSKKEEEFSKLRNNQNKSKPEARNKTFQKLNDITKSKKKKKKYKVGDWRESDEEDEQSNKKESDETKEMYAKSQQKLLAKAKIYERMQQGDMEDVEDYKGETRYLVDFDKKYYAHTGGEASRINSSNHRQTNDKELTEVEKEEERRKHVAEDIYEADLDYRDKLHEKWRKEQDDLLNGPVHYENLKFDEIRNLGTGYYAFSKDEEERKKQMEGLKNMREETKKVHKKREILQQKRKAALDARLMKVKQRKAEEEGRLDEFLKEIKEEKEKPENNAETEDKNLNPAKLNIIDDAGSSNDKELTSQTDALLKECRGQTSKPTREWDQGKNSTMFSQPFVKSEKQQQQQQQQHKDSSNLVSGYERRLENLRKDRPEEFAPPSFY